MKINEILTVIKRLAHSQGFYGRLYQRLTEIRDNDPDMWDTVVCELESQEFGDSLSVALYFEA